MPPGNITLSHFNWVLVLGIGGGMAAIIGFLAALVIRWFKADLEKMDRQMNARLQAEAASRERADLQLADTLREITHCLTTFKVDTTKTIGGFATRDELHQAIGKIDQQVDKCHARLDDIYNLLNHGFVTKQEFEAAKELRT